jgi:glycosyltransferase involved in cell wall biosynthesis
MAVKPEATDPRIGEVKSAALRHIVPPGEWPANGSVPVAVLIPVKNEEANIVTCLRHVQWAQQLVVVDSQSSDRTVPLAQAMGAEVYQFRYSKEGWPKKKNWALESVPWRQEWVLIVDADEHMTPDLASEIEETVTGPAPRDGYYLNRRFMFMGRWIKHCGYYPSWNLRLFKHRLGRYERIGTLGDTGSGDNEVHEHVVLKTGSAGYLKHDFLHYAYPDLATWVEKHNRYSTWEAHAAKAGHAGGLKASPFGGPLERRRWLKAAARRLPFRPWLRFFYSYVLKGGFLDGYPGYCMCRLLAWYEFLSKAKYYEMTRRGRG